VIDINSRQSIVAVVWLAVLAVCMFILQPGFVQGLGGYLGFTEQQAGQIAAYEMFGIAATTVLLSFISPHVSWRRVLYICLAICVIGNLASVGQTEFMPLSIIRFLTGLGSGGLISLTFTMMGLTTHADRNFGHLIVWVLVYGAFGLLLMPTAFNVTGMNGVFIFFAVFCATGFYFLRFLPDSGTAIELERDAVSFSAMLKAISLSGILVYNIAIGIVWAYLFLIGLEAGMEEQSVANALTISQFLGVAGAMVAVVLDLRLGRLLPLAFGILGGAMSIYLLIGDIGSTLFWIGVCGFNFLWNVSMPYLLAMLADFDHRGRIVIHGVSMQFIGYAIGPLVAAQLLSAGGYDMVNSISVGLFVLAAILLIPGILAQRERM
jgi:predicted MFS family arabinose efflux permease